MMSKPNPFLNSPRISNSESPPKSNRFNKQFDETDKANDIQPSVSNRWSNIQVEDEDDEYGDKNYESRNTFQRSRRNGNGEQGSRFKSNVKRHGTMELPQNTKKNINTTGKYQVSQKSYFGVKSKKKVEKKEEFDLAKKTEDFPSLC